MEAALTLRVRGSVDDMVALEAESEPGKKRCGQWVASPGFGGEASYSEPRDGQEE